MRLTDKELNALKLFAENEYHTFDADHKGRKNLIDRGYLKLVKVRTVFGPWDGEYAIAVTEAGKEVLSKGELNNVR